jgi:hypothetical protein
MAMLKAKEKEVTSKVMSMLQQLPVINQMKLMQRMDHNTQVNRNYQSKGSVYNK